MKVSYKYFAQYFSNDTILNDSFSNLQGILHKFSKKEMSKIEIDSKPVHFYIFAKCDRYYCLARNDSWFVRW